MGYDDGTSGEGVQLAAVGIMQTRGQPAITRIRSPSGNVAPIRQCCPWHL